MNNKLFGILLMLFPLVIFYFILAFYYGAQQALTASGLLVGIFAAGFCIAIGVEKLLDDL